MVRLYGKVLEDLHRRKIDFCCDQETRWNDESTKLLGAIGRRHTIMLERL